MGVASGLWRNDHTSNLGTQCSLRRRHNACDRGCSLGSRASVPTSSRPQGCSAKECMQIRSGRLRDTCMREALSTQYLLKILWKDVSHAVLRHYSLLSTLACLGSAARLKWSLDFRVRDCTK